MKRETSWSRPAYGRAALGGVLMIGLFFGGFALWAVWAPLESAAIADGVVNVDGRRKTIQHLEGGIVSHIAVREGQFVAKDQILVQLESAQANAVLQMLTGKQVSAAAQEARYLAERDEGVSIEFPDWLLKQADVPLVREKLEGQRAIFLTRRQHLHSQRALLSQTAQRARDQITSLRQQIRWSEQQIGLIDQEIVVVRDLVRKGYGRKPRLLALQRGAANIRGRLAYFDGQVAQAEQVIAQAGLRLAELETRRQDEVTRELRLVQEQLADLAERLPAARDVFRRTTIRAPIAGRVVDLRVTTIGGVVMPGHPMLDIVPQDERLVIEARVHPNDIDVVRAGLDAEVRLTAFDQRTTPTLAGTVSDVSADSFTEEKTGLPYYLAQIALTTDQTPTAAPLDLYPGMPVEVLISTGSQTVIDYLLRPLSGSIARAMREQ